MIMIDTFRHELLLDHMGNSDGEHDTHDLTKFTLMLFHEPTNLSTLSRYNCCEDDAETSFMLLL
jgi:hypothetical protein